MDPQSVARKVKLLREAKGLTQAGLADAIGRHRITVARLEAGKAIARTAMLAIANALQIPARELIDEAELDGLDEGQVVTRAPESAYIRIPIYAREDLTRGPQGEPLSTITLPSVFLAPTITRAVDARKLFATDASGEMNPTILAGDVVIIEADAPQGNGVALFSGPGGVRFGRSGGTEDVCIGRVAGLFRRV